MGRRYSEELNTLTETYSTTQTQDIRQLREVIDLARAYTLLVIGSGGSTTACDLTARLHESFARLPARALTPLEFIGSPKLQAAAVLLLSAGGANPDILTAAEHAVLAEHQIVIAICTRRDTPLRARLSTCRQAHVFEFIGPSPKDGFLATNSLLLTSALLARAYGVDLPSALPHLDPGRPKLQARVFENLLLPSTIVLAHGWAVPAALDFESKWSECGFGSVTVTDERNFAHGRHYGLSRRLKETLVLGFATAGEAAITKRTLARLPSEAKRGLLATDLAGPIGALDLIAAVIRLAGAAGQRVGLDPGQPKVPTFGRALYRARITRPRASSESPNRREDLWIERKVSPAIWANATDQQRSDWRSRCHDWVAQAEAISIVGVVLDYDGTLCEMDERFTSPAPEVGAALTYLLGRGLHVGVATGRGDSVAQALRAVVPKALWRRLVLGIYNGSTIFNLDEAPPTGLETLPEIEEAFSILSASPVTRKLLTIRKQRTQISVQATTPLPDGLLWRLIAETLATGTNPAVNIYSSGHSVDVVSRRANKQRVVEELWKQMPSTRGDAMGVLTIGDQGRVTGNDFGFLAHTLGLSVESVSTSFDGCWNVGSRGSRRTTTLLQYLRAISETRCGGAHLSVNIAAGTPGRLRQRGQVQ